MKRAVLFFLIISSVMLLSGCDAWDRAKTKVMGGEEEIMLQCPECECPDVNQPEPDKVAYFFEKPEDGILKFMSFSEDKLYCVFNKLDDDSIASEVIDLFRKGRDVKVVFDRASSFENCEVACVPRTGSKYNKLLAEGMDLKMKDTNLGFCLNELGVFFYSGSFVDDGIEESHVFWSKELSEIYVERFNKLFS